MKIPEPEKLFPSLKKAADGTYRLKRRNESVEHLLDKALIRVNPRELIWIQPGKLWQLKNEFRNQHCHVVGKGPSLDKITGFPDSQPVFCINESIVQIEGLAIDNPLFATQIDPSKRKELYLPKRATMVIPFRRVETYKSVPHIACSPLELGLKETCLSALYVLAIAKVLGFTKAFMWAFDAITSGNVDYARSVGQSPTRGGDPKRFLSHGESIQNYAARTGIELVFG